MTVRLRIVGLLAVVVAASFAVVALTRHDSSTTKPVAMRGVFSDSQWQTVERQLAERGFRAETAKVVAATDRLALVTASRPSGKPCFVPVSGTTVGPAVCRLRRTLTVFEAAGRLDETTATGVRLVPVTNVVGIVPRGVVSVVAHWSPLGRSDAANQALLPAGAALVFAAGFRGTSVRLTALDAQGATVARFTATTRR